MVFAVWLSRLIFGVAVLALVCSFVCADDDNENCLEPLTWPTGFFAQMKANAKVCFKPGLYYCSSALNLYHSNVTLVGPKTGYDPRPSYGSTRSINVTEEAVFYCDFSIDGTGITFDGIAIHQGSISTITTTQPANFTLRYSIVSLKSVQQSGPVVNIRLDSSLIEYNLFTGGGNLFNGDAIAVPPGVSGTVISRNEFKFDTAANGGSAIYSRTRCNIEGNIFQPLSSQMYRGAVLGHPLGFDSEVSGGDFISNSILATLDSGLIVSMKDVLVVANLIAFCKRNPNQYGSGARIAQGATYVTVYFNFFILNGMQDATSRYTAGLHVQANNPHINGITVANNCFVDNQVGLMFDGSGTLNATYNWWGHPWGPYPTGFGDTITKSVGSNVASEFPLPTPPAGSAPLCRKLIEVDTPDDPYLIFNESFVERWNIDSSLAMPLTYTGDSVNLTLHSATDNGTLASDLQITSLGSYSHEVTTPTNFSVSRTNLLLVQLSNTPNLPWVYGVSNLFEIDSDEKNITITSPVFSAMWKTGRPAMVKWEMTGHLYGIDIIIFNGTHQYNMVSDFDSSQLEWRWNQVATTISDGYYQIKIVSTGYNRAHNTTSDSFWISASDIYFTVLTPNTGTVWIVGTTVQINWASIGNTGTAVDILLYKDGLVMQTIASSVNNSGQFTWEIVSPLEWSLSYSIEIQSVNYTEINGVSLNFEIDVASKALTLEDVPMDTFLQPGTYYTCHWNATGYVGRLYLEFDLYGLKFFISDTLMTSPNGTGEYTIFVPSTVPSEFYTLILKSLDYTQVQAQTKQFSLDVKSVENVHIQGGYDFIESPGVAIIVWSIKGTLEFLRIELVDEETQTSVIIAGEVAVTPKSFQWAVPSRLDGNTNYSIQITSTRYPLVFARSELLYAVVVLPSSEETGTSTSSALESSSSHDMTGSSLPESSHASSGPSIPEDSSTHRASRSADTSQSGDDNQSSSLDGPGDWVLPAVIGGGLGFALLLLFLILLVVIAIVVGYIVLRTLRGKGMQNGDGSQDVPLRELSSLPSVRVDGQTLTIPFEDLKIIKKLASGSFGTVFTAKWHMDIVAVKKFNFVDEDNIKEFENEIKTLVTLRHENVLLFMGACVVSPDFAIVTEYCANGSLNERLHKPKSKVAFSWNTKIQILSEISSGLQYLHRRGLIHRDLKSHNVLLTKENHAKLADFGLSKTKAMKEHQMTSQVGTPLWMAPEVTLGKDYNETCDIFSFAMVMYELFTERLPYYDQKSMLNIHVRVATEEDFRPTLPMLPEEPMLSSKMERFMEIMIAAWHKEPRQRISLADIYECAQNELLLPDDYIPKTPAVAITADFGDTTMTGTLTNDTSTNVTL